MNTLSDKLTFTVSYTAPTSDAYYIYYISTSSSYVDAIYKGRFFAAKGSTSVTIYLNDILMSERPTHNILEDYIRYINEDEYQLVKRYYILAYVPSVTTQYMDVLLTYKYPYKDFEMGGVQISSKGVMPLLQGVTNYDEDNLQNQRMLLYPKYPRNGNKLFMATQAFCDGLNFAADSTKMVTLDSENHEIDTLYSVKWDEYTSRVGVLTSTIPNYAGVSGIGLGIQNKAIGDDIVVTGKKLWVIEVNDQWNDGDESIIAVAEKLGYDEFYANKFAYLNTTSNTMQLYFVYETNDESEIDQAFEDAGCTYQYYVEEKDSISLWDCSYHGKNTVLSENNFKDFVRFMGEAIPSIDEDHIRNKMGIEPGTSLDMTIKFYLPYKIYYEENLITFLDYFEGFEGTGTFTYEDFFDADSRDDYATTYKETYKETSVGRCIRFADIEDCDAHYYLQWIDRFGGVQCLPFDHKETKSIEYDKTYITNQYGEKRLINTTNTLQFEINSGWLKDEYMPIYESIFISPYMRLYDATTDKVYNIISTDESYTEMTRDNQKRMFNLTIKLNVNADENILY